MDYNGILQFRGVWRNYQARVLKNSEKYMADGKVHIVAAPGSGKTTLGIELIRRMNENVLILTPSITIREQWVARIEEAFLCDGILARDYISQNLKQPKAITVVTYQALHSAMTRFKGTLEEGAIKGAEERNPEKQNENKEEVDFLNFDLISKMKENHLGLLCLDECHHLRSEWWKALEEFRKGCKEPKLIALTATPPYDSTPAMWNRYLDMCGEIDEEITIPELVKEGSLCPHQDFVYFNYPTKDEEEEIQKFEARSSRMVEKLMQDAGFLEAVKSHAVLTGEMEDEVLTDDPEYLEAFLIYLQEKKIPIPSKLKRMLGTKKLPDMSAEWMEKLLQGFLYSDTDAYACEQDYPEKLEADLKSEGLIEKKKVILNTSDAVEKLLIHSKGKANSIRDIVFHEYETAGKELRLLILTDYIRKEYEKAVGNPESDINALGVLPFFEMLRREVEKRGAGRAETETVEKLRLGVLCGTIVVIPAEAKEALDQEIEGGGKVNYSSIGALGEEDYLKVTAVGDAHFLTGAVTSLFTRGLMQVLIGTKSLLGEGWDSPCINSLILASFVGSFMLSNQMRGRAIRVFSKQPEKTSNIWHLVCLKPWNEAKKGDSGEVSEDYQLLERRMEHFLGLHYTEEKIETGLERLSYVKPPFSNENVMEINRKMLLLSGEREKLRERWEKALAKDQKIEIVEQTSVKENVISDTVYRDTLKKAVASGTVTAVLGGAFLTALAGGSGLMGVFGVLTAAGAALFLKNIPKLTALSSPVKRLRCCGMGIRKAMLSQNLLENEKSTVAASGNNRAESAVYLTGGSSRDKTLFAQCVNEFFAEIDDQRYLLMKRRNRKGEDGFYAVPECFARKKEDAEDFAACLTPYIGDYELVYTRNERGKELLLEGRVKAMAAKEKRSSSHKVVRSNTIG